MCKCRSHGTFPLRLQSSHLNICYYHQDLHRRPLRRLALLGFAATAAPPTHRGLALAPTAADFDFHDHRPAVLIDQHPLWVLDRHGLHQSFSASPARHSSPSFGSRQACSHSNPSQKIKVGRLCTHSLVRVSRRVEWGAHRPTPEHADAEARREARAADHDKAATPPLALDGIYRPIGAAFPNNPTQTALRGATGSARRALTLSGAPFQGTWARSVAEDAPDYNSTPRRPIFKLGSSRLWVIKSFRTETTDELTRIEFTTACQDAPGILSSILANARVTHGDQLPSDILERIGDDDL
ncbi:hypothetical protein Bca101_101219 [Brassica carinata]